MLAEEQAAANELRADLDLWARHMTAIGDLVPYYWDELNTPERLGDWLAACGWRRVEPSKIAA